MKHFLSLEQLTPAELTHLLELAVNLKREWQAGGNRPLLQGKSLAMLFQKASLRTRVSFEMGMVHLGGHALCLAPDEVKMGTRETPADVARVLSGMVSGIMARVFDYQVLLELAEYATIPVINGLSDYNHPSQALSDLLTILEHKGQLAGVKVAYVGDGNNVARSLMFGCMLSGMEFAIASPAGYGLSEEDGDKAEKLKTAGAKLSFYETPGRAVEGADVIYTDVWVSMGQESEAAERRRIFPPYQVNETLLKQAHPNCIVMHCLPAHRGEEISAGAADGPHSVIFHQSANRLHAQKAVLATLLAG